MEGKMLAVVLLVGVLALCFSTSTMAEKNNKGVSDAIMRAAKRDFGADDEDDVYRTDQDSVFDSTSSTHAFRGVTVELDADDDDDNDDPLDDDFAGQYSVPSARSPVTLGPISRLDLIAPADSALKKQITSTRSRPEETPDDDGDDDNDDDDDGISAASSNVVTVALLVVALAAAIFL